MKSKITGGDTELLFTAKVLQKHDVKYYICKETGFIQTEEPYWLDEAYSSAITKLDVGLVNRNLLLADIANDLIIKFFNYRGVFLDNAGGYGLFTRLMRDKGFDFYSSDKYCQNLFAEYFDLNSLPQGTHFEMVTAFEVFEHLTNPVDEIKQIYQFSDNMLFTTELQPDAPSDLKNWPYIATETGQHIAFYNIPSLQYLAKLYGCNFYTNGKSVHLFTKKPLSEDPFGPKKRDPFLLRKARKYVKRMEEKNEIKLDSLIWPDWQLIKDKLNG
ncbi:class I SAM-dependent methyltransferase [Mucilaginibacter sp. 14171R-50]|uniref:class I SAM-dependent methyltransferase n=1 Tax=Mucilaginibacter sp. 14171R-50 TaxID=2703789 RepID=UPI00138C0049|nr:class I SAM-dependent methyltransferase [Mucilaginibacter sp. 14171R-50]QHS54722.1 class I SAM-dependent methyltransferase [Mucilaginibacter sp. 14171R-50]